MRFFFIENLRMAFLAIKGQLLRAILTILIIAFGIMALVGILTAIDSIQYAIKTNFALMGSNTFSIKNRSMRIQIGNKPNKWKKFKSISYDEAIRFKEMYNFPALTSVYVNGTGSATLKYCSIKTKPNIRIMGVDENYVKTAGYTLAEGRNFSNNELLRGSNVVIIGSDIAKTLFEEKIDPLNKFISAGQGQYRVIGVLKEKGSSIGFGGDRQCFSPILNIRRYLSTRRMNYTINVNVNNPEMLDEAIGEARGVFRIIRKVPTGEQDSFDISKSDKLAEIFLDNIRYITLAATIIGLITLLGAAIGLMNIMLVSVAERTREIGIMKAVGATNTLIKRQFLFEAILIGQLGGILGIILGILIGNMVSMMIGAGFIIPWAWMFLGIGLCVVVGLVSGIYPAIKASKCDPIESLRYE